MSKTFVVVVVVIAVRNAWVFYLFFSFFSNLALKLLFLFFEEQKREKHFLKYIKCRKDITLLISFKSYFFGQIHVKVVW